MLLIILVAEPQLLGNVYPTRSIAYKGTAEISIFCYSTSPVTWVRSNGKHIPKRMVNNNTLVICDLKCKDSDNYTCYGTNYDIIFSAQAEVLVGGN